LLLTDLKTSIGRGARLRSLKKAFAKDEIQTKWAKTAWAKKMADKAKKASYTDFDRFKVMLVKKQV
jgi:large subunit ribosomal protein L14e